VDVETVEVKDAAEAVAVVAEAEIMESVENVMAVTDVMEEEETKGKFFTTQFILTHFYQ